MEIDYRKLEDAIFNAFNRFRYLDIDRKAMTNAERQRRFRQRKRERRDRQPNQQDFDFDKQDAQGKVE